MSTGDSSHVASTTAAPAFITGWRLVGTISVVILLIAFAIAYGNQFDVDGVRMVIRATARSSLLLFGLAFTASALYRLWPNALTRWQRNNRRYLGVSFAASHTAHAIAIIWFAQLDPNLFHEEVGWFQYVFGGLAYAFIAAMTATSFDRTAAWIGLKAWRALHTIGAYYIAISFLYLEFSAAIYYPYYRPFAAFAALILIIRFIRLPTRRQASVVS